MVGPGGVGAYPGVVVELGVGCWDTQEMARRAMNAAGPGPLERSGMSNHTSNDRRDEVRAALKLVAADLANAKRAHKDQIRLAREHGFTFQEIGSLVGLSEARIRQMLRNGEAGQ